MNKGIIFEFIGEIKPYKDNNVEIVSFEPANDYDNMRGIKLNQYGKGLFCKFSISQEWKDKVGVYIIKMGSKILYIGETEDFATRFNNGYGKISPRNCYVNGQSTNCRINHLIYECLISNNKLELYFLETSDRFRVERSAIRKYQPEWNISKGKQLEETYIEDINIEFTDIKGLINMAKYDFLYDYLMNSTTKYVKLTVEEVEKIIDEQLPKTAISNRTWWANDKTCHVQAKAWLEAGYRVSSVDLGNWIEFIKSE